MVMEGRLEDEGCGVVVALGGAVEAFDEMEEMDDERGVEVYMAVMMCRADWGRVMLSVVVVVVVVACITRFGLRRLRIKEFGMRRKNPRLPFLL
jgi:hypothetical protein